MIKNYLKFFSDFYKFTKISNNGLSFVNMNTLLNKKIIYIDFDFEGFVTRNNPKDYLEYLFKSLVLDQNYIYIIKPNNISEYILELFLDYKPELFSDVLLEKYGDNLRIKDIISPFGIKEKISLLLIQINVL